MRRSFASILLLTTALSISGCATVRVKHAGDINAVCGKVRVWEPGWQTRLADELGKLPTGHIFRQIAIDALDARDAVRICRGESVTTK
jgi:hypothetical protein